MKGRVPRYFELQGWCIPNVFRGSPELSQNPLANNAILQEASFYTFRFLYLASIQAMLKLPEPCQEYPVRNRFPGLFLAAFRMLLWRF
jgi:hypothetical protein